MRTRSAIRLYGLIGTAFLLAAPASAQFTPRTEATTVIGEKYHLEAAAGFWTPSADMKIASESLGIVGTNIDFKKDLGLKDQRFGELHFIVRPSKKQKLFFQYIPINYTQSATLTRNLTFNGQLYRVGVPVNSTLNWKAYRFGYEYDAFYRERGFVGFIVEAKYTDVTAKLATPITNEFAHAQAPIPSIGGIGRFYVVPRVAITGQLTGFKIPDSISEEYKAHFADFDLNGTVNITENVGARFGFRSFDVGYLVKKDTGSFVVKGLYFGGVIRY